MHVAATRLVSVTRAMFAARLPGPPRPEPPTPASPGATTSPCKPNSSRYLPGGGGLRNTPRALPWAAFVSWHSPRVRFSQAASETSRQLSCPRQRVPTGSVTRAQGAQQRAPTEARGGRDRATGLGPHTARTRKKTEVCKHPLGRLSVTEAPRKDHNIRASLETRAPATHPAAFALPYRGTMPTWPRYPCGGIIPRRQVSSRHRTPWSTPDRHHALSRTRPSLSVGRRLPRGQGSSHLIPAGAVRTRRRFTWGFAQTRVPPPLPWRAPAPRRPPPSAPVGAKRQERLGSTLKTSTASHARASRVRWFHPCLTDRGMAVCVCVIETRMVGGWQSGRTTTPL